MCQTLINRVCLKGSPWGSPSPSPWGSPWGNSWGNAWGSSSPSPWGNPWGSSWGNPSPSPWGNAWGSPWESSSPNSWGNSWGSSSGSPWGSSSPSSWGNSRQDSEPSEPDREAGFRASLFSAASSLPELLDDQLLCGLVAVSFEPEQIHSSRQPAVGKRQRDGVGPGCVIAAGQCAHELACNIV